MAWSCHYKVRGAILPSLYKRISEKTYLLVYIAEELLRAVVKGNGNVIL